VEWFEQTLPVRVLIKVLVGSDRIFLNDSCFNRIVVLVESRRPRLRENPRTYRNGNELPGHEAHLSSG